MIDPRWQKWLNASINTWFKTTVISGSDPALNGIKVYFEGDEIDFNNLSEWVEVRTDGPHYYESSKGDFLIELMVNVMISVKKSVTGYRLHDLSGIIQSLFQSSIPVLSYGESSPVLVTCLTLIGKVDTHNWGEMGKPTRVLNCSVEANYTGVMP